MKKILILFTVAILSIVQINAQNYRKQSFDKHLEKSANSATEVYTVKTGYPTTAIIVSINQTDKFDEAYVVVDDDTTYLHPDEDAEEGEINIFSNLITFSNPIDSFYFFPGKIGEEVTFYFINASSQKQAQASAYLKKKVPAVPNQTWWTNQFGELVCLHRITTGSISRYLM